jgi:SAM-dependent methyltransferase
MNPLALVPRFHQIVLNVGGGSRNLPPMFDGWTQDLLDIDPACKPDLCMDARKLVDSSSCIYDAVHCSHNLEHVFQHEVRDVLRGFAHVLKPGGFAWIAVPDIAAVIAAAQGRDINEPLYHLGDGTPISFHDVLYGWGKAIASGNQYMAHKTGFTPHSFESVLKEFFPVVLVARDSYNLTALCIKGP